MLTLKKCREILGSSDISDELAGKLRDEMYALANTIADALEHRSDDRLTEATDGERSDEAILTRLPEEVRDEVTERAGIREFDGGLDRDNAFRSALIDAKKKWVQ